MSEETMLPLSVIKNEIYNVKEGRKGVVPDATGGLNVSYPAPLLSAAASFIFSFYEVLLPIHFPFFLYPSLSGILLGLAGRNKCPRNEFAHLPSPPRDRETNAGKTICSSIALQA